MSERRPILVTGSHRSGTGWVGQMIAATPAPPIGYIWEPFNLRHRPGIFPGPTPYWFHYVCAENEAPYLGPMRDMLAFRYHPAAELASIRTPKDAARFARDWAVTLRRRRAGALPLLKDPIAVFSAAWLAERFDMAVVMLIRHPAGFASSIVGRHLTHPFEHFVRQPLLMRDLLEPFETDLRRFAERERPLLEQAILLWNVIHHAILRFRERHPEWLFLRLEDLAEAPGEGFREIYRFLDLPFDPSVERAIDRTSAPGNPAQVRDMASIRRDSRASVWAWKERLPDADVDRVRRGVAEVAPAFYGDLDW